LSYDYYLPDKNLALEPSVPRDNSKLLVYDTKNDSIVFDRFYNLDKYLPKNSFLVLNNTKVLPARVLMRKASGGKVVVLFLVNEINHNIIPVMVDRKILVGEKIYFNEKDFLEIVSQDENIFNLEFLFSQNYLFSLLKKYGSMPIPPYLKKSSLSKDDLIKKYQTIFAKKDGSAAAPTASLHFTDRIFKKIEKKGLEKFFVTLHVGLGTFAPIGEAEIIKKKLHEEYFEVDEMILRCINPAYRQAGTSKHEGKKLIAVGTTVTRTLESLEMSDVRNDGHKIYGKTDLFIFPPYNFKMVDILITNFHLPKSSLMMLVEAFLQYKKAKRDLVSLYKLAIINNFRFYSFGDAMLII
jgi:S-adenosylmethionine:tRNA ribosyltransferase-isomerase